MLLLGQRNGKEKKSQFQLAKLSILKISGLHGLRQSAIFGRAATSRGCKWFLTHYMFWLLMWVDSHDTSSISFLLQVLFLMYHYFAAAEIYNAIRVFIAAYVWMTGFGNFSYYYVRKDFSLARFAQVFGPMIDEFSLPFSSLLSMLP